MQPVVDKKHTIVDSDSRRITVSFQGIEHEKKDKEGKTE